MTARVLPSLLLALLLASPAGAAQWDTTQEIISPPDSNATLGITSRNAVVDGQGTIHLVYQNNLGGEQFQLTYVARDSNGVWSLPVPISPSGVNARNASMTIDHAGRLHVLCELASGTTEDIAHFMRDVNGTWSTAPELVAPSAGFSRSPMAAVDSFDKLHVVWVDGRDNIQRILHATWSSASGWQGPDVLSVTGTVPQDPTIDTDELGGIHIFWSDRVPSPSPSQVWNIFYERLDAAVPGIPPPRELVHGGAIAIRPYVEALDDGTVHLVWLDSRASTRVDAYEIYYKRYLPGIGWGKDKRFTYDITNHARPVIVAGAGHSLNVAWEDYRFGSPDIFYRQITPETGWDRDLTQLTTDESASQFPTLVSVPNGHLVLIWSDSQQAGTFRIFAKDGRAVATP